MILTREMEDMKKLRKLWDWIQGILLLASVAVMIIVFIKAIIGIIYDLAYIVKLFFEAPLAALSSISVTVLIFYIVFSWDKRDDFFYFIASILSSPSEYLYKRRKKQLINYRDEIKELRDLIDHIADKDRKDLSGEDFWKLVEATSRQNERLEKNRAGLEKKNDRINLLIQVLILCCGVVTSLFL